MSFGVYTSVTSRPRAVAALRGSGWFFFCLIVSSFYRPSIVPIHKAVVQLRHVLKKCGCTPLQRQLGEHFNASFVCLRQQRFTSTGVAELRPLLSTVPAELERLRHCPFLLSSLFFCIYLFRASVPLPTVWACLRPGTWAVLFPVHHV